MAGDSQKISDERLTLVSPGCLGTCWHGRYHYVEPWAGCEHACHYCYARFRSVVQDHIDSQKGTYENPLPLFDPEDLPGRIREEVKKSGVKIVKLSRFTDIFTPSFSTDGLSCRILESLCESGVERIIITTKGTPGEDTLDLFRRYRDRFSYNVVAKPDSGIVFEPGALKVEDRLRGASDALRTGVQVTVHMDPIVTGFEDKEENLREFFRDLKSRGLTRVMFSYLLLSPDIINHMRGQLGDAVVDEILEYCNIEDIYQCLPGQSETSYISARPEHKKASILRITGLLREMGFDYVLCSLKSDLRALGIEHGSCNLCDGSFYA